MRTAKQVISESQKTTPELNTKNAVTSKIVYTL